MKLENFFRTLIEHTPDTIARYDYTCHCTYANQVLANSIARPVAEIVGKTPMECFAPSQSVSLYQEKIAEVFDSGQPYTCQLEWRNGVGENIYSDIRLIPERDLAGKYEGNPARGLNPHGNMPGKPTNSGA